MILRPAEHERHDEPYTWVHLNQVLPDDLLPRLEEEFPTDLDRSLSAHQHYQLLDLTVVDRGQVTAQAQGLTALWRDVIDALLAPSFRQYVEAITGADLASTELKVRLCEYGPGDYMTAHTDKPDRVATAIVYLSSKWEPAWGGQLDILTRADDHDLEAIAATVWPLQNTGVVFVRSDRSFHVVRAVTNEAPRTRRTILAQFVATSLVEA